MQNSIVLLLISMFVVLTSLGADGQLGFPEHIQTDKSKSNLAGRSPLYAPTRCAKHELLYPGDQVNDWICDCAPAAVFYPETEKCYPTFYRGPCAKEEMLVLFPNKVIPECIPNACKEDGQIQIKGVCHKFGSKAPCENAVLSFVLGVDPATLQVDCVKLSIALGMRFGDENEDEPNYDLATVEKCARGTKRAIEGRCPEA